MVRKSFATAAALAALCLSSPALAAPSTPDAARIAAAGKLLNAMHYDAQTEKTLDAVIAEVQRSLRENLNKTLSEPLPPEVTAKIAGIAETHLRQSFNAHRAEMKRGTELIYARHFTAAELERLAALQSDPVMAKMQMEMPEIMAESMALSQGLAATAQAGLQQEIQAVVLEYLKTHGDRPSS